MTSPVEQPRTALQSWQQITTRFSRQPIVSDEELEEFEIALQRTLRPVDAPSEFRDGLRRNLAVAAQRRYAGLEVAARRSYSQGIIVGTSVGLFALLVGMVIYFIFRPHPEREAALQK